MKKICLNPVRKHWKYSIGFILLIIFSPQSFSQTCSVEKKELNRTYTGDCKNGKADGKGKAIGIDTYDGDFKKGFPEGKGTYIWSNGDSFIGNFLKGLRDGEGRLIIKRENAADSIVTGFWKKDIYIGKYEKPYTIYFKSKLVMDVEVEYKNDNFNQVTFFITNTSGGGNDVIGNENARLKLDEVHLTRGSYGRLTVSYTHVKKTESVLSDVLYPFRMKAIIGSEEIEIEFREKGSYVLNVSINQ